jgi:PHD/YefM family antitoxin component YafN of YafNO toxin-antitoxin module
VLQAAPPTVLAREALPADQSEGDGRPAADDRRRRRIGSRPHNVNGTWRSATSPGVSPPGTIAAVDTPDVIPITDFRRGAARIIASQVAAERPVYITQGGYVTAVVLSPERYRDLIRLTRQTADCKEARRRIIAPPDDAERERPASWFGFVDAETADALEASGWELE